MMLSICPSVRETRSVEPAEFRDVSFEALVYGVETLVDQLVLVVETLVDICVLIVQALADVGSQIADAPMDGVDAVLEESGQQAHDRLRRWLLRCL